MAFTNETNVADFYCRTGLPESMAISGIPEHKLFTENIILHRWSIQKAKSQDGGEWRWKGSEAGRGQRGRAGQIVRMEVGMIGGTRAHHTQNTTPLHVGTIPTSKRAHAMTITLQPSINKAPRLYATIPETETHPRVPTTLTFTQTRVRRRTGHATGGKTL